MYNYENNYVEKEIVIDQNGLLMTRADFLEWDRD